MTIDSQMKAFIRHEIRVQMNVILSGQAGASTPTQETITALYPGQDDLLNRPKMLPFGISSRAPVGTISVVAKQGENPGNRIVLGHRDPDAPDVDEGTTKVYSVAGFQVYAADDGLYIGKDSADSPMLLGDVTNDFFGQLIDLIQNHVHGPPGSPPTNAAQFAQLKLQTIENDSLLAIDGGGL